MSVYRLWIEPASHGLPFHKHLIDKTFTKTNIHYHYLCWFLAVRCNGSAYRLGCICVSCL